MDTQAMNPTPGTGGSVSHPSHYANKGIEPREYIKANNLDFNEGNIIKYITRHKEKGEGVKDIIKVISYARFVLEDYYNLTSDQVEDILIHQVEDVRVRANNHPSKQ